MRKNIPLISEDLETKIKKGQLEVKKFVNIHLQVVKDEFMKQLDEETSKSSEQL